MRKLVLFVAVGTAFPVLAQETRESSSQAPPPAATQTKPVATPAAKLKGAAATQPVDPNAGKTIEEIIARVNNEIITLTEYEKARQSAEEDAKQE